MTSQTEYQCKVEAVFSGDDLVVLVDLEVESLWKKVRIRLSGVDTPNGVKQAGDSEAGKIRDEVRMLTKNKKARLRVVNRNSNSWVVTLFVDTPSGVVNVNEYLIGKGYRFQSPKP